MIKVEVYSNKGKKLEKVSLPKSFEVEENLNLLAQAYRVYSWRGHIGLAKTKTRSEVERTKKKVYRQKGTGGARHGSKSAPIYVGGGIAHGRTGIRRILVLPKKMKNKALKMALNLKAKNNELIFVKDLSKFNKTKDVQNLINQVLKDLKIKKRPKITFVHKEKSNLKAFANLENSDQFQYQNLNALKVLNGGLLILDENILKE
jgi:large subunit ribosomal protein L4